MPRLKNRHLKLKLINILQNILLTMVKIIFTFLTNTNNKFVALPDLLNSGCVSTQLTEIDSENNNPSYPAGVAKVRGLLVLRFLRSDL